MERQDADNKTVRNDKYAKEMKECKKILRRYGKGDTSSITPEFIEIVRNIQKRYRKALNELANCNCEHVTFLD